MWNSLPSDVTSASSLPVVKLLEYGVLWRIEGLSSQSPVLRNTSNVLRPTSYV